MSEEKKTLDRQYNNIPEEFKHAWKNMTEAQLDDYQKKLEAALMITDVDRSQIIEIYKNFEIFRLHGKDYDVDKLDNFASH